MKTNPQAWRWVRLCGGVVLLGVGIVATRDLDHDATARILPRVLQDLIWFGPALALVGSLVLAREFPRAERWLTRRKIRVPGLVMLAISLIVWLWVLATDRGGDASWGIVMIALMSSIYVGLPGLLLTLASFVLRPRVAAPEPGR